MLCLAGVRRTPLAAKHRRPAYTLLEVLVAAAVSVMLMAALYMAINLQLRHAQIGRDVVEQSQLSRALLARIDSDIRLSLGPPVPSASGSSNTGASSTGSGANAASSATSTATTGANGTSNASTTGASSSTSAASASSGGTGPVQFNLWVQGDTNWIMLYISRVPRDPNPSSAGDNGGQPSASDLRRVSYWLAGGGDNPLGLARQEVTMVTSDQAMADVPPGIPDEASHVIADEVKSLTFSYFDGTNWQDTWDGTAAGPDGSTPVGPPLAIAVTIGLASPTTEGATDADQPLKLYRHVVSIPTANGVSQPATSGTTP
jgi:type II secretory pathway pseudopilin PulG